VLFGAGTVEEVLPGATGALTDVEGDGAVVFTVVAVVGFTEDDVVGAFGLAVVVVVWRANRRRAAASAGEVVLRVATPTATASAEQTTALNTTSDRFERTTCVWVSSSMHQQFDNEQLIH